MPRITCPNGHKLQLRDDLAGKKIKCPRCGAVVAVPKPEVIESEPEESIAPDWSSNSESDWDESGDWNSLSESDPWGASEEGRKLPPRQGAVRTQPRAAEDRSQPSESGNRKFVFVGLGAAAALLTGILVFVFSSGGEREAEQAAAEVPQVVPPVAEPTANGQSNTAMVPPAVSPTTASEPPTAPNAGASQPSENSASAVSEKPKPPAFVDATVNDIAEPDSHLLVIDQRFQIRLDQKPTSLKFFLAKRGQDPPSSLAEWIAVSSLETNEDSNQRDLTFAAAMTKTQTVLILTDDSFAKLKTLTLPVTLQIGSEVLQVVALDDFKEIAEVRRSSGIYHNVSEPIRILPQGEETPSMTNNGIPFLEETALTWFPDTQSAGEGTIYLHWNSPAKREPIRFRWDVTIADAGSIQQMVRDAAGPESNELAPLPGESWSWNVPASGLPVTDESKVKAGNKDIEKDFRKISQKSPMRILAKFAPTQDGGRTIIVGADDGSMSESISVPAGAGVPLLSADEAKWKSLVVKVDPPELSPTGVLESTDEGRALRVQWLNGFPAAGETRLDAMTLEANPGIREFQCVTSADGKTLYLLGASMLMVIDNSAKKPVLAVRFKVKCLDVALCSEGVLVATWEDIQSQSVPVDSVVLRPHRTATDISSHGLYVLDPRTLKVKKVYGLPIETLASHENSSTVFAGSNSTIFALDLKQELVTDVVPVSTLERDATGSGHVIDGQFQLTCDSEQKTLVAVHESSSRGQYAIFQSGNGTLRFVRKSDNRSSLRSQVAVASDASLMCYSPNQDPRRHFIVPGSEGSLVPSMPSISSPFPAVVEPASHSLWSVTRPEGVTVKPELVVTQGRSTHKLPLEKRPRQMERLGANRVLLIMDDKLGLAELQSKVDFWPFEVNLRNEVPAIKVAGSSDPSIKPLATTDQKEKGLRVESVTTSFVGWTPSGDAAILMEVDSSSSASRLTTRLRRLELATRKETHNWTINTGRVVNRCEATGAGLLFFDANDRRYTLLNYQDLAPVWTIDSMLAGGLTGHREHSTLVGMSNGVIVMDGLTRRIVARSGAMNLAQAFESEIWNGHIRPTNDPAVVAVCQTAPVVDLAEQYRLFQVRAGNLLVPTNESMDKKTLIENLSRVPAPAGYTYLLRGGSNDGRLEITDPNGKTITAPFGNVSAFAPHPVDPQSYAVVSDHHVVIVAPQQASTNP